MMGLIRNILIIVFCCLRTLTLLSQEKNLVYKTSTHLMFDQYQTVSFYDFGPSFPIMNTGGYSLSAEAEPSFYFKQWFAKVNLGLSYSRQRQLLEMESEISEPFSLDYQHKINTVYSGVSIGRAFNINDCNIIEFQLGYELQIPFSTNNPFSGGFAADPVQGTTDSPLIGSYENNYVLNAFYSPFARLGCQFEIKEHPFKIFLDYTLFAMQYTVNHEVQLEDRYYLSYSQFFARSIGFGIGYTF